jgi:hypothetical protein
MSRTITRHDFITDAKTVDPRIYRLAPELRRSALIGIVGCALVTGVAYWAGIVVLERDLLPFLVLGSIFVMISLALVIPLRWALYVDGSGIARRWLLRWDHWSWSDFGSGHIHKCRLALIDPRRSWWARKLDLGGIASWEIKELMPRINQHYRLPDARALPESLEIEYGFRRRVQFDRHDIRVTERGVTTIFSWNDVQRLRITRDDPVRRDYARLKLLLPGHEIELRQNDSSSSLSAGAKAEETSEFLLAHVPRDRVVIDIQHECPVQKEDVQKDLDLINSNLRQVRICFGIVGFAMIAILIGVAVDEGLMKFVKMTGIAGLIPLMYWVMVREFRKQANRLELWLVEIDARGKLPVKEHKPSVDHWP